MHINAQNYLKWIESEMFRNPRFGLNWVDLELLMREVIRAYKLPMDFELARVLEDEFVYKHLENSGRVLVYKRVHKETGKIAVQMLKNDYDWSNIHTELQYVDMLNRCVLYKFKNSAYVKQLIKNYKLKLQN